MPLLANRSQSKKGGSGGGDPEVTEFLLIAHRLRQWQLKHPEKKIFDLEVFTRSLSDIQNSLHPLYPNAPRLQATDMPLVDENGVAKKALFTAETGEIIFNSQQWGNMHEPLKYTLVATEFTGLAGGDRYLNSLIIYQHAGEISQEYIELEPVFKSIGLELPKVSSTHSFSTSSVGNSISWLKNLLEAGLYRGTDISGQICLVKIEFFPKEQATMNGIEIAILPQTGRVETFSIFADAFYETRSANGELKTSIAKHSLSLNLDTNHSASLGGSFPWIHRDWTKRRADVTRDMNTKSVSVRLLRDDKILGQTWDGDESCRDLIKIGGPQAQFSDASRLYK